MDIREEYVKLINDISYYSSKYYNDDEPEISDYDFDLLMRRLKEIEKNNPDIVLENSPTKNVGGKATKLTKIKHRNAMLSLRDVFNYDDVAEFINYAKSELDDPTFLVETKIDGLSMSLRYLNGKLSVAETRGDGIYEGEDVTENAKMINDVVQDLHCDVPYIEIRGEVYINNKDFDTVNELQDVTFSKKFSNPRNCAAGSLRQTNPDIVKERNLSLFIFNLQECEGIEFKSHSETYDWLEKHGVKVISKCYKCKSYEDVIEAIELIGDIRGDLPYNIDGAVIKIDSFEDRKILGETNKYPRWSIAYKYPAEEKETIIRNIELNVGRTGILTPVAVFDTINLCGTNVSRATLHNQKFIEDKGINIGSIVKVFKAGDIIPEIREATSSPWKERGFFIFPDYCPCCGSRLLKDDINSNSRCINISCVARVQMNIINFCSRDAMNIKGMGNLTVKKLCDAGFVYSILDLYYLKDHRKELLNSKIFGDMSLTNIFKEIESSKNNSAERLLAGFGIPGVGKTLSKTLMYKFGNIKNLEKASYNDLYSISGVGAIIADPLYNFFHDDNVIYMIKKLEELGVNLDFYYDEMTSDALKGLTFAVTGSFDNISRSDIINLIESNHGLYSRTINDRVSFIVVGKNSGEKARIAKKIGIPIISELELYGMCNIQV